MSCLLLGLSGAGIHFAQLNRIWNPKLSPNLDPDQKMLNGLLPRHQVHIALIAPNLFKFSAKFLSTQNIQFLRLVQ